MKVFRILLGTSSALLLTIIVAVWLLPIEWGVLKAPLSAWLSAQVGRTVVIDGEYSLRLGRTLRFSAAGVRVAAASGDTDMLTVTQLSIEADSRSLFKQPVVIHRLVIEGAQLLLDGSEFQDQDEEGFQWPKALPVVIDDIVISSSTVQIEGPRLSRPLIVHLDSVRQQRSATDMLELTGEGQLNEIALRLQAEAGPFDHLVAGRDFRISLNITAEDLTLSAQAQIDDVGSPLESTVRVQLQAPDSAYLQARLGLEDLGSGPVQLDGQVMPAEDGRGIQAELKGQVGSFGVKASGQLANPAEMEKLSAKIEVSGPDLGLAGGLVSIAGLPAEAFDLNVSLHRAGDALQINQATLVVADSNFSIKGTIQQLDSMAGNDLDFLFEGPDAARFREWLELPQLPAGPFRIVGQLKHGDADAELLDVTVNTALAELRLGGKLGAYPDYYGTQLHFTASGENLKRVSTLAGIDVLPAASFATAGDLEWLEKGLVLRNSELSAAKGKLVLDGRIGKDPLGPDTDLRFVLSGSDFRLAVGRIGVEGVLAEPYEIRGRLRRVKGGSRLDDVKGTLAGARLKLAGQIGDQPMRGTDLEFSVEGPRLEAFAGFFPDHRLPSGQFSVAGGMVLRDDQIAVRKGSAAVAGAEAKMDVTISLPLDAARGRFDISAKGSDLSRVFPKFGDMAAAKSQFDLSVRGEARGGQWSFEDAHLTTSTGSISGKGTLDWAPDFSATDLRIEANAENLAELGRLVDIGLPAESFALKARVSGTPAELLIRDASGNFGDSDFAGSLGVTVRGRTRLDLDLRAKRLDLRYFLRPDEPVGKGDSAAVKKSARMIPDTPLPLDWLDKFDASVVVSADRMLLWSYAPGALKLKAALQQGELKIESLEMKSSPDGHLKISGSLAQRAGQSSLNIAASGTGVAMSWYDDSAATRAVRPRADIELQLSGQGKTVRDIAASLNGRLSLLAGPGTLPGFSTGRYFTSLWKQLAATVIPGAESVPSIKASCMAVFLTATNGVAATVPAIVLQTDNVNMLSQGSIDLRDEKIAMRLRVLPRRQLDISIGNIVNPNVRVTGTLAEPAFVPDAKGTLVSGGAAIATGGLSILAVNVWERVSRAEDPCAAVAAEAKQLESGIKEKSLLPASLLPKWLLP